MSKETNRDVFEDALDTTRRSYPSTLSASLDISDLRYRYVYSLPDKTDRHKNCPYCHEVDPQPKHAHYGKAISDKTEYFDFVRKTKPCSRVKARIKSPENKHPKLCVTQMNRLGELSVVLDMAINYCPICGRKLC